MGIMSSSKASRVYPNARSQGRMLEMLCTSLPSLWPPKAPWDSTVGAPLPLVGTRMLVGKEEGVAIMGREKEVLMSSLSCVPRGSKGGRPRGSCNNRHELEAAV
jgi:hypothetical protein